MTDIEPSPPRAPRERGPGASLPGSDYTDDERIFLLAMERYQREKRRRYPSWREVLQVVHDLGYRKTQS